MVKVSVKVSGWVGVEVPEDVARVLFPKDGRPLVEQVQEMLRRVQAGRIWPGGVSSEAELLGSYVKEQHGIEVDVLDWEPVEVAGGSGPSELLVTSDLDPKVGVVLARGARLRWASCWRGSLPC